MLILGYDSTHPRNRNHPHILAIFVVARRFDIGVPILSALGRLYPDDQWHMRRDIRHLFAAPDGAVIPLALRHIRTAVVVL
jgi:hypothetical protein